MKQIQNKTDSMRLIEALAHQEIEEVMRQLWVEEELTVTDITKQLRISRETTRKWLRKAGIHSKRLHLDSVPFE